ncbi:tetratricopeptide repeat protein [Hwangdonia lutea]|uniref:Tetratricopeptide repeat protein n=1 Tax=Hwangdonia lutea TaxID=3075823 RepID=A0AA97EMR0_9FLAO|nr:tetratricopeptide repeat protein [Hwangdonia sp. SCSIO 19198]WOD43791.1 tetratricopeptide repeat protein [Hwangdonia sp. SCSIO 19198]
MKKSTSLLLLFALIIYPLNAQNTTFIDSLKKQLSTQKDNSIEKVNTLTWLHEKLMFSKPEEAKSYADEVLSISKKINYDEGIAKGYMHLGHYFSNRSKNDSALYYLQKAKEKFTELEKTRGVIFINHSLSDIMKIKGNYDEAIKLAKDNLNLILNNPEPKKLQFKLIGGQHALISNIYIKKGNYNIALTEALTALKYFEEINHLTRKADVLKQIGDIELILNNPSSAKAYFNQAIKIYEDFDDKMYMAYAYNSKGQANKSLGMIDNAFEDQNRAVALAREINDKSSLSGALIDLGALYTIKNDLKKANKVLDEANKLSKEEDIKQNIIYSYLGLSEVMHKNNKPNEALKKLEKAISIAKSIEALPGLQDLYDYKSKILEAINKNKEAIFYLKASQSINDSLFSIKKSQQIEELKTIYETEKKETEIALQEEEIKTLNVQAKNDKLTKTVYGIGMFSFIAIAGLIFFSFKQRIKKNNIEREKQEAIYQQEIEFKKKELASQTLHLVQKNTFIQELKENLEKIKQSPELFKVEFRRLVLLLKKESAEDKDWEIFKSYFSEVHNNFDIKLKEIYADITEKEIRLASFLRMNLSTKEIASMLNVLPESVLKSKYRLKKKLNLNKETDLNGFLNSL